jgi:hypothetical protein
VAELVKIDNNHEGYFEVLYTLFEKGRIQDSRNGRTIEVQDLVIEVANPLEMAPNGVRPGYNVTIGWVEGLQLIAGITDSALTTQVQPNFRAFMEHEDARFWGAYGPRLVDQLPIIAARLAAEPDTRQAVTTLWDPEYDARGGKKDHPCTTAFVFQIRDGKLNMSTLMRSNDLWWGWPYDSQQFAMLHLTLAGVLELPVGTYTHHAVSAHLYEPHWAAARETLLNRTVTESPIQTPMFNVPADMGLPFELPNSPELYRAEMAERRWNAVRERAFTTYRAITQTLPTTDLKTEDEVRVAQELMKRRTLTLAKELKKLDDIQL